MPKQPFLQIPLDVTLPRIPQQGSTDVRTTAEGTVCLGRTMSCGRVAKVLSCCPGLGTGYIPSTQLERAPDCYSSDMLLYRSLKFLPSPPTSFSTSHTNREETRVLLPSSASATNREPWNKSGILYHERPEFCVQGCHVMLCSWQAT